MSVNRLARLIVETARTDVDLEYVDRRDIDNIRRRVLNIEKIRRELRWVPAVTLEEGLRRTYEWLDRA
jgi:UDP-glucose 4-epimerase